MLYIASSESSEPNRNFFGVGKKLKERILGDESLPLLAFRRDVVNVIFLEYSKEGKLSPSQIGIRNIPSDVMMTQNIVRCMLNAGIFRNHSSI